MHSATPSLKITGLLSLNSRLTSIFSRRYRNSASEIMIQVKYNCLESKSMSLDLQILIETAVDNVESNTTMNHTY